MEFLVPRRKLLSSAAALAAAGCTLYFILAVYATQYHLVDKKIERKKKLLSCDSINDFIFHP